MDKININECGISSSYKDDREVWKLSYDGSIRSMKDQATCLMIASDSWGDLIPTEDMTARSSSTQPDQQFEASKLIDQSLKTRWISAHESNFIVVEVFIHKCAYIIKEIEIAWHYPAKNFEVFGLLDDGYWKSLYSKSDNRDQKTNIIEKRYFKRNFKRRHWQI